MRLCNAAVSCDHAERLVQQRPYLWERAEETLVTALVLFIYLGVRIRKIVNFATVMFLLRKRAGQRRRRG